MGIRKAIEDYVLTTGNYTLDNPVRRVDGLRSDVDTDYNVKPIEGTNGIRLLPDPFGERGRKIHIIV